MLYAIARLSLEHQLLDRPFQSLNKQEREYYQRYPLIREKIILELEHLKPQQKLYATISNVLMGMGYLINLLVMQFR